MNSKGPPSKVGGPCFAWLLTLRRFGLGFDDIDAAFRLGALCRLFRFCLEHVDPRWHHGEQFLSSCRYLESTRAESAVVDVGDATEIGHCPVATDWVNVTDNRIVPITADDQRFVQRIRVSDVVGSAPVFLHCYFAVTHYIQKVGLGMIRGANDWLSF